MSADPIAVTYQVNCAECGQEIGTGHKWNCPYWIGCAASLATSLLTSLAAVASVVWAVVVRALAWVLFLAFVWLAMVVMMCAVWSASQPARGAPVPIPRSAKKTSPRAALLAAVSMRWGGMPDDTRFSADGGYSWKDGESLYLGTWTLVGCKLEVTEAPLRDGRLVGWVTWTVTLAQQMEKPTDKGKPVEHWQGRCVGQYNGTSIQLVAAERLGMPKETK